MQYLFGMIIIWKWAEIPKLPTHFWHKEHHWTNKKCYKCFKFALPSSHINFQNLTPFLQWDLSIYSDINTHFLMKSNSTLVFCIHTVSKQFLFIYQNRDLCIFFKQLTSFLKVRVPSLNSKLHMRSNISLYTMEKLAQSNCENILLTKPKACGAFFVASIHCKLGLASFVMCTLRSFSSVTFLNSVDPMVMV